jgi:hypothetical protein
VDAHADIWALEATLCELLAGNSWFTKVACLLVTMRRLQRVQDVDCMKSCTRKCASDGTRADFDTVHRGGHQSGRKSDLSGVSRRATVGAAHPDPQARRLHTHGGASSGPRQGSASKAGLREKQDGKKGRPSSVPPRSGTRVSLQRRHAAGKGISMFKSLIRFSSLSLVGAAVCGIGGCQGEVFSSRKVGQV